jgi:hypothetical protein
MRTGSVSSHGRTFTGLIVPFSRLRMALAVAAAAGFVAVGVWIVSEHTLAGIATISTFSVLGLAGIVALVKGVGALVLTEDEIAHVAAGGRASVRWDDVIEVERHRLRGTELLRISSASGTELGGFLPQLLAAIMRRDDLEIALGAVGVDSDWLVELIERCVRDPAERARVASGASASPDASPGASA